MMDLRIGGEVTIHYDNIDGLLVANRIELASAPNEPDVRQLTRNESPES